MCRCAVRWGFFVDWSAKPYASLVGLSCWWGHTMWTTTWVMKRLNHSHTQSADLSPPHHWNVHTKQHCMTCRKPKRDREFTYANLLQRLGEYIGSFLLVDKYNDRRIDSAVQYVHQLLPACTVTSLLQSLFLASPTALSTNVHQLHRPMQRALACDSRCIATLGLIRPLCCLLYTSDAADE